MISHDVLIIGGGLAGLRAAIAAGRGADVAVVSRVHPLRSNSVAAREGINAALGNERKAGIDSIRRHMSDTTEAGCALNAPNAVEILCEEAPDAVFDLERWGAPFDREEDGLIAQSSAAPGAFPRTCLAGPHTGHALLNTLFEQTLRWGIRIYPERRVLSLVVEDRQCLGAVVLNPATGEVEAMGARVVILAAGGCGRLYGRTSNALHCTGSGMAMGYRAGAPLADMEFVQFHPLAVGGGRLLLPEALLERGHLLNGRIERFMEAHAIQHMEHAPGDVLVRAIAREIAEGRAFSDGCARLDFPDLSGRARASLVACVREEVKNLLGLDPVNEPMPVAPAEQCIIGGLDIDEHGETCIQGLLAAGECACSGAHGARVLTGNALLDALVFSRRAGERAGMLSARRKGAVAEGGIETHCKREEERIQRLLSNGSGESPCALRDRLASIMWDKVGPLRDEKGLSEALYGIRECRAAYANVRVAGQSPEFNSDLMTAIDVGEMIDVAEAIALSAQARRESRGVHYRTDFAQPDDSNGLGHTKVVFSESGPEPSYTSVGKADVVGSASGMRRACRKS
ncbi:MAG: FAD-binding protein [Planctomycetota bacterium]